MKLTIGSRLKIASLKIKLSSEVDVEYVDLGATSSSSTLPPSTTKTYPKVTLLKIIKGRNK